MLCWLNEFLSLLLWYLLFHHHPPRVHTTSSSTVLFFFTAQGPVLQTRRARTHPMDFHICTTSFYLCALLGASENSHHPRGFLTHKSYCFFFVSCSLLFLVPFCSGGKRDVVGSRWAQKSSSLSSENIEILCG